MILLLCIKLNCWYLIRLSKYKTGAQGCYCNKCFYGRFHALLISDATGFTAEALRRREYMTLSWRLSASAVKDAFIISVQ